MFSIIRKIRKSYAKLTQVWNDHEKEMSEWAQKDPEAYTYYIHYCHFHAGGDIGGITTTTQL